MLLTSSFSCDVGRLRVPPRDDFRASRRRLLQCLGNVVPLHPAVFSLDGEGVEPYLHLAIDVLNVHMHPFPQTERVEEEAASRLSEHRGHVDTYGPPAKYTRLLAIWPEAEHPRWHLARTNEPSSPSRRVTGQRGFFQWSRPPSHAYASARPALSRTAQGTAVEPPTSTVAGAVANDSGVGAAARRRPARCRGAMPSLGSRICWRHEIEGVNLLGGEGLVRTPAGIRRPPGRCGATGRAGCLRWSARARGVREHAPRCQAVVARRRRGTALRWRRPERAVAESPRRARCEYGRPCSEATTEACSSSPAGTPRAWCALYAWPERALAA